MYRRKLEVIQREKEHTLSAAEENILAQVGEIAVGPQNIYSMFNNADIKFPSVRDVEGNRITITHGNFIKFMNDKDRSLRKEVFRAVYNAFMQNGEIRLRPFLSVI